MILSIYLSLFVITGSSILEEVLDRIEQVSQLTYRAIVVRPESDRVQCNSTDLAYQDPVLCLRLNRGYGQYEFRLHTQSRPFTFLSRLEDRKRTEEDWGDITRLSPETELNSRAALWKQVDYLWRRVIEHAGVDVFFLHSLAGNCELVKEVFKGTAVRPRVLMLPVDWRKKAEEKPEKMDDDEEKEAAFWMKNFQCSINDVYKAIPSEYTYVRSDNIYAIFVRKDLIISFDNVYDSIAWTRQDNRQKKRVCDEDDGTRGMGNDGAAFIFSAFADPKDCKRSCWADKDCTFWTYSTETMYCWNWGDRTQPDIVLRAYERWTGGACRDEQSTFDSRPVLGFQVEGVPTEIERYRRGFCEGQICYCYPPFAGAHCEEKFDNKQTLIVWKQPVETGDQVREIIATRTPTIALCDNPEIFFQEVGDMPFAFAHGVWVYPVREAARFGELPESTRVREVERMFA